MKRAETVKVVYASTDELLYGLRDSLSIYPLTASQKNKTLTATDMRPTMSHKTGLWLEVVKWAVTTGPGQDTVLLARPRHGMIQHAVLGS